MTGLDRTKVYREFHAAVNMSGAELEAWLAGDESRRVGWTRPGEAESVGRAAGRAIVGILGAAEPELDEEDYRLMRKAVGVIRRHRAQRPENVVTSRWRYALMNWGYDPLKGSGTMQGYIDDIEQATLANEDFRRVLYTGRNLQLVLMTLPPGCDIGEEVHDDRDQFFRIEEGEGVIRIDGVDNRVEDDFAVIVPAGARHNVINTGEMPLRLYTIYAPPEHRDGVVHATKEQAERDHDNDHWDGGTTE